ncbi:hypothetical protein ASG25_10630 [Rhizobium sp. Leaf384]|uniref:hypothetical protein n=1 Tax=Rhizobium sp. Leaf384 TaxID=1736358 RepID=UPI000713CCC0|nr:hypothetical protein [Rhizobium sp. Leaf384]KQS79033.1 hypothetical protein ASG25_10630 [Rhizobium sp. Leaf384]
MRMSVQPGRVRQNNRGAGAGASQQRSAPLPFPSPTLGLMTNADIASQTSGAAMVLENWLPTLTGARIRGGSEKWGLAADGGAFVSAFRYVYGSVERMFMSTATAIYDMSAPAVPPTTTAAVVTGLTGGDFCTFQQANADKSYLVCFNGMDTRKLYDGATWGTAPAITFPSGDTTTMASLNFGWVFKKRQFLIKNGSLDAYFLGLDSVGGVASLFPLGGVMRNGGSLLSGFSWSIESGDGPNEYCVFLSTEGEVAVYSGSNPTSADDFGLVGVYQIGRPLGKNAFIRSGGDVLIATVDGLVQLSQSFQRDRGQLSLVSVSRPIEDIWRAVAAVTGSGWTLTLWPEQNLVFVCFPNNPVAPDTTLVLNALTSKWSLVTNWAANCFACFQKNLFFGSTNGLAWHGDYTGTDDGMTFQASFLSHFAAVQGYGQEKVAGVATMRFRASEPPKVRLFARADMDIAVPSYSTVSLNSIGASVWDVGFWDAAKWDGDGVSRGYFKYRQNVRARGDIIALGCAVVSGGAVKLDVELDLGTLQITTGESNG